MSESTSDIAHTERAPVSSRTSRPALKKAKAIDDSRRKKVIQWLFDNQTSLAFHTIAPLLLAHVCVPAARPYTSKFFKLSYHNTTTGKYGAGHDDLCFVAFCVVLLIGIRAAMMRHVLGPLGQHWGISKKKDVARFSEQGWMLVYYSALWPLGMYLYYKAPYYLNMKGLWANWPQRELNGLMKGYIMVQWAYWVQQVISVNIEARRKDYWEMIVHHAITISLIAACYAYHQTRVGHLILVLMDVIELIFPLAKCLKYIGFATLCDVIFGVFLLVWVWTRHVFYLMTCWSVYYDLPQSLEQPCFRGAAGEIDGPFAPPEEGWSHLLEPFKDPAGTVCMTSGITKGFLTFLLALEVVICAWSFFIIRVTVRVLKGSPAEDVRSDVEVDEEEEEVVEYEEVEAIEEDVGVESIDLKSWERSSAKKESSSRVSGVRTHSGRKELLNRIGCEKQID
ncbi:TLC domain-containing protein [Colletotrichum graminicola]|uniref:TLC domain-containing protein n=1 Tax=Colletotrichum graminicola (strain M1.001 / M2 / FGSC 10212) TaxID=645133 RepID=E3QN54_COLGM|nr:TLC domain-containing protein [Colletotrichum graminicola M1.001]EFQ32292.1 TLC domain-containing protein [Colletotrichum graminicola M1.001]WDK19866.1 TLC domain-containing protein [Colletotrichum graminicola]